MPEEQDPTIVAGPGAETAETSDTLETPETPETSDADARLIRSVRWRLVGWSGGTTLLVLIVLAIALYASVANSLASTGVSQLNDRAADFQRYIETGRPGPGPGGPSADFGFGGDQAGTFALLLGPQGDMLAGPGGFSVPAGLPDAKSIDEAKAAGRDLRTSTISFTGSSGQIQVPVRILTIKATNPTAGTFFVQVVQDRTTEARTLAALLLVLLVGGGLVVLVAVGFGAVYARRALVPIRESLGAQRLALRRQREFAADASHELRTPLTVIRASVEYLRRHADEPVAAVGDALRDIDDEVRQMTSMVEDLLLLARSDSGAVTLERVPLQLDDVAAEATAALSAPAAARGVRLLVDPEPAPISGDPARLRQLVMILVDNAIRHSPAGGEVRIGVRSLDGTATLAVADQGPGIRSADLPHLFDRFWRAAGAPAGGTGLGLSIAKWIAEQHAGSIAASSPEGGGARFEVRLPTASPAST
jgi:two-component system, OmpR family, sensor histidine kinase CiaH